jgi:hypothetical protein
LPGQNEKRVWRTLSRNADVAILTVAACCGLGLFLAWAAQGFTWSSPDRARVTAAPAPRHVRARVHAHAVPPPVRRPRPRHRSGLTLTLLAARGPAWVSVRAGPSSGRTLYEGLLPRRKRITLVAQSFVGRFQAAANLDVLVGTRRADLRPYELRPVAITRAGIRLLATGRPGTGPAPAVIAS